MIGAATRLFAERGWSGTGMRDIAKAAGVSVEPVYGTAGSKAQLLMRAVDVGVVGDDEPIPLAERAEFRALGVDHSWYFSSLQPAEPTSRRKTSGLPIA